MILRVRGVKRIRSRGRVYYYHRATGVRLPDRDAPNFMAKVNALNARQAAPVAATLGGLVRQYRTSPEWTALAPRTHKTYNRSLDYLKPLHDMPLMQVDRPFVYGLRDEAMARHKRGFANQLLQVLQLMWNWGARRGICEGNPAFGVERVKRPRNAPIKNRPWRGEELDAALTAASPPIRVAIALAAYAGLRESDVVRATWGCYDGQAIETRQGKTGLPVWVPAHYRLREILDATARVSPLIVIGKKGKPYTADTLRNLFFRLIGKLAKAGQVGPGLSFHGLRHTLGTRLAEAGCDAQTIASVLGQRSTSMAEHYSRTANRRGNASAAIRKLEHADRNAVATKTENNRKSRS